jgi:formate dehydrogenase iron-sulfur subunit
MIEGKTIFIDTTKCVACRGCQIACKQWHQRAAGRTINRGSHQNPPDLSYSTWKLVRFSEIPGEKVAWYFFPDQCRHCLQPPCKVAADMKVKGAVVQDETTGAVIYNPTAKMKNEDFIEIREACPYDIPRINAATGIMAKCTMCLHRVKEGMLPACVKTCPTGAMNFGNRKEILQKATQRLEVVKEKYKNAMLTNPDDVRIFYLLIDAPEKYHKFARADSRVRLAGKTAFRRMVESEAGIRRIVG